MDEHRDCCGGAANALDGRAAATNVPAHRVVDPVCGMTVDPAISKHQLDHAGQTFHFCSASCREKFAADPTRYLKPNQGELRPSASSGTLYTCPMHPQVRQDAPGRLSDLRHGAGAADGERRRPAPTPSSAT